MSFAKCMTKRTVNSVGNEEILVLLNKTQSFKSEKMDKVGMFYFQGFRIWSIIIPSAQMNYC